MTLIDHIAKALRADGMGAHPDAWDTLDEIVRNRWRRAASAAMTAFIGYRDNAQPLPATMVPIDGSTLTVLPGCGLRHNHRGPCNGLSRIDCAINGTTYTPPPHAPGEHPGTKADTELKYWEGRPLG